MKGKGKLIRANGESYEGEFANDLFEGYGKFQSSLLRYEGQFSQGVFHGQGIQTYKNNSVLYSGGFQRGFREGKGKL